MSELASAWLCRFTAALAEPSEAALEPLFVPECYWRDLVAFTWNLKTAEGLAEIAAMAAAVRAGARSSKWALKGEATASSEGGVEAWLRFETEACACVGHIRLKADGRCWTLTTAAEELKAAPNPVGPKRAVGLEYGCVRNRVPAAELRRKEKAALGAAQQPFVVIVGGGQCGLALAARLRRMQVPALVLEKHGRPGDCWRRRYDALHLHDPVFANHLPFMEFPEDWPLWPDKNMMADWLEVYVKAMDIAYWGGATCLSAKYEEGEWRVVVERGGEEVTLWPKHLVLATGLYGRPQLPALEGRECFGGVVMHSSEYKNGEGWAGRRAVVVGANTSAHDIAQDLWEAGAEVTMVQRSATMVTHIQTQLETVFTHCDDAARAKGATTEQADLVAATVPYRVVTELQKERTRAMRQKDAEYYRRLEAAGFRLDFGEDGGGNVMMFLRRGAGYYFDTGACELVSSGEVALRHGEVTGFTEAGVALADGARLPAELVVLATGYRPLSDMAEGLLGKEVADRLGSVWGLGSGTRGDPGPWEGELRGMWKPTGQEGLWVQGGNLSLSRSYSKYLALQLQARYLGMETPVHGAPLAQPEPASRLGGC